MVATSYGNQPIIISTEIKRVWLSSPSVVAHFTLPILVPSPAWLVPSSTWLCVLCVLLRPISVPSVLHSPLCLRASVVTLRLRSLRSLLFRLFSIPFLSSWLPYKLSPSCIRVPSVALTARCVRVFRVFRG